MIARASGPLRKAGMLSTLHVAGVVDKAHRPDRGGAHRSIGSGKRGRTGSVSSRLEQLDHRRDRGQQQITVKHVTVNADQAVVTDQIVSAGSKEATTAALLTSATEKPVQNLEKLCRSRWKGPRRGEQKLHG